jgi:hypothetical protein
MNGIEIQEVKPIYSASGARALQHSLNAQTLYRAPFGSDGARYYFRKGVHHFYAGYSLWTSSVIPKSSFLLQWMVDEGEAGKQKALEARVYGSALHHIIAEIEREEGPTFKFEGEGAAWWMDIARAYIESNGLSALLLFDAWCQQIKNDIFAWFAFKRDYKVNVLAVEFPVYDDEYLIATPADVIALMEVDGKEVSAAIDIKATTRAVAGSTEYALQLYFIRHSFNKLYGHHFAIERTFNWSLMDRAKSPGKYRLEEQKFKASNGNAQELFDLYARLVRLNGINEPSGKLISFVDGENGEAVMLVEKPIDWLKRWQSQSVKP